MEETGLFLLDFSHSEEDESNFVHSYAGPAGYEDAKGFITAAYRLSRCEFLSLDDGRFYVAFCPWYASPGSMAIAMICPSDLCFGMMECLVGWCNAVGELAQFLRLPEPRLVPFRWEFCFFQGRAGVFMMPLHLMAALPTFRLKNESKFMSFYGLMVQRRGIVLHSTLSAGETAKLMIHCHSMGWSSRTDESEDILEQRFSVFLDNGVEIYAAAVAFEECVAICLVQPLVPSAAMTVDSFDSRILDAAEPFASSRILAFLNVLAGSFPLERLDARPPACGLPLLSPVSQTVLPHLQVDVENRHLVFVPTVGLSDGFMQRSLTELRKLDSGLFVESGVFVAASRTAMLARRSHNRRIAIFEVSDGSVADVEELAFQICSL